MLPILKRILPSAGFLIMIISCSLNGWAIGETPLAQQGIQDLRNWDWKRDGKVSLVGEWKYLPGSITAHNESRKDWQNTPVPQNWLLPNDEKIATYRLQVLLPEDRKELGLFLQDIGSAYRLWNGEKLLHAVGQPGEDLASTISGFQHLVVPLKDLSDSMTLYLEVANFHYINGGILSPIYIGREIELNQDLRSGMLWGGLLSGGILLAFLIHGGIYLIDKKFRAIGFAALIQFALAIHLLTINDRFFFDLIGPDNWGIGIKVQYETLFLFFLSINLTQLEIFVRSSKKWLYRSLMGLGILSLCVTVLLPPRYVSFLEYAIPIIVAITICLSIVLAIRGLRQKIALAWGLLVINFVTCLMAILDYDNILGHMGNISYVHYGFAIAMLGSSLVLLNRVAQVIYREAQLSKQLEIAKSALEAKNEDLEAKVNEKSRELIEQKEIGHQLEMEMKQRDLELVKVNMDVKRRTLEKVVGQLEEFYHTHHRNHGLKGLIQEMKSQSQINQRLDVIAKDTDQANVAFYKRLSNKFPDLTKTEREICALLLLNMSSKEIARLRSTSVNSVNVARSRIRKKVGLDRTQELEPFLKSI